ncbi:MAG: hypothetical protein QXX40_00525 [Sulfolobales archaeon]
MLGVSFPLVFVGFSRVLRALGVIKSSRVCKPVSTHRCFGDPGLPRPTADRGDEAQGNRGDPP